jgi:hypothetical protein
MLEEDSAFDLQSLWDRERVRPADTPSPPQAPAVPSGTTGLDTSAIGSAIAITTETDRLVYRASAPRGGYLVQVASLASGWRAWVDGHETPVYRANGLFRAVALPPGEHEVEFRYEPRAVALGRAVSDGATIIAVLGLLAALGIPVIRRRLPA